MSSREAKELIKHVFALRRSLGILSVAHDERHVENVAIYGSKISRVLARHLRVDEEYSSEVAETAGYLHDIVRRPGETEPHGPEGAKWILFANGLSDEVNKNWGVIVTGLQWDEKFVRDVAFPVEIHESPINEIIEVSKFYTQPSVRACAAVGMKIADALLEASGYRVIERRAKFVGYERTQHGDLQFLKDLTDWPHRWAILGETMIRLYKRNPVKAYPEWIRDLAEELHAVQYAFYKILFGYLSTQVGVDQESELAEVFLKWGFPKFDEQLVEKIHKEAHLKNGLPGFERINKAIEKTQYGRTEIDQLLTFIDALATDMSTEEALREIGLSNKYAKGLREYFDGGLKIEELIDTQKILKE